MMITPPVSLGEAVQRTRAIAERVSVGARTPDAAAQLLRMKAGFLDRKWQAFLRGEASEDDVRTLLSGLDTAIADVEGRR